MGWDCRRGDSTASGNWDSSIYVPFADTVHEFKVQNNSFTARGAGSQCQRKSSNQVRAKLRAVLHKSIGELE
jgi:hypothetical protein